MEPLEIVCESCESRMRLSESLLQKIAGKSGRVTCRDCASKIMLDATRGSVRVTKGGRRANALELEEIDDFTEGPPSVDPHLSEFPLDSVHTSASEVRSGSLPIPPKVGAQSIRLRAAASSGVAAALKFSQSSKEFEAPVPDFSSAGSLSPHSLDDDEDDSLVTLGREFNSSPFASERDQSYNSLFPEPARKPAPVAVEAPAPMFSRAPALRPRGAKRRLSSEPSLFKDDISTAPAVAATIVEMAPDGQLINQADKKKRAVENSRSNRWVPWTVAAIALLGLGVSVSLDRGAPVALKAVNSVPQVGVDRVETAATSPSGTSRVEEPSAALVEEQMASADEALAPLSSPSTSAPSGSAESIRRAELVPSPTPENSPSSAVSDAAHETAPSAETAAGTGTALALDEGETEKGTDQKEEVLEPVLPPFSSAAAATAMRDATALAAACRKSDDPSGYAKVVVTFAPSGRVTSAAVSGAPFAGTETGGCIASRFRTARVPAFAGEHVTVKKTVTIQ